MDASGQMYISFDSELTADNTTKRPYKAVVSVVYDKTGDGGVDMFDVAELFRSGENQLTELSGRKVLLVFYASWSRPAMDYVQAVKSYAESQDGKAFAVLIDADAYPDIARKYGLEAVPLTVLYLEGMKLKDMVGGITAPRLNELIEQTIRVQ